MNLVDSSAWLSFFFGDANSKNFENIIKNHEEILVPSICLYEVFKTVLSVSSENDAINAIVQMKKGKLVNFDLDIALLAGKISHENKLAMADSIILASAQIHQATIWTLDADFKHFENVKYFQKI